MAGDTYMPPPHGWTCFHCGETFMHVKAARVHFGPHPGEQPGCIIRLQDGERGLLGQLRAQEIELERYRAEDSDKDREMAAMRADHAAALRAEEEKGYARGVRDGRKYPADA